MQLFTSYLCFLTCGISILFTVYLLFNFGQHKNTYYLIGVILSIFFIEFYMYALNSKSILDLPFLFRTALPFRAVMLPFLWIYIWAMLHPNQKLKKLQLLHFIIPFLIVLGLLPDFLKSSPEKVAILKAFYLHNNTLMNRPAGLIPSGIIQPFLSIYGIAYSIYTLYYINLTIKQKGAIYLKTNKIVLSWLKLVTTTILLFIVLQLLQYFTLLFSGNFNSIAQIGQSTSLILMKAYFLLNPLVKENMDGCIEIVSNKEPDQPSIINIKPVPGIFNFNDQEFLALQTYFFDQKTYLNPDLTISKTSIDLGIHKNRLSGLIQDYYGIGFSELVNRLRINNFIDLFDTNKNLTMETIIYKSGFVHRSTFYAAFKKHIGINPTTYIKEQRAGSDLS